jgi:hypothetical protein
VPCKCHGCVHTVRAPSCARALPLPTWQQHRQAYALQPQARHQRCQLLPAEGVHTLDQLIHEELAEEGALGGEGKPAAGAGASQAAPQGTVAATGCQMQGTMKEPTEAYMYNS